MNTRLTIEYGLETPIVSAGMAFVSGPELAAAVSNAGALGMLGAGILPPDALRALIGETRKLTDRPFGVDLIPELTTSGHIDVCAELRVPVVAFFWSLPAPNDIRRLQEVGSRVWFQSGSLDEAVSAADAGVDLIVVQGAESGGHNRSEAATMTLLPAVIDAVFPLPVLAAGGIVDGRGLAAVLMLGAAGAWCGTRFLASQEADASAAYQSMVLRAGHGSTVRTDLFGPEWPGQPCRVFRNRVVRQYPNAASAVGVTGPGIGSMPLMSGKSYSMPKFSVALPTRATTGDIEEMALTMGESAGRIRSIEPAASIVARMTREAADCLRRQVVLMSETTI
jgi:enoyl-[acyl-carrier protein] reductase II